MSDVETTLRSVLSEQASAVDPPVGVYAAVRRRHARRQRTILAAAVVVLLVVVAVPVLLRDRSPAPTARTLPCPVSFLNGTVATGDPGLPAQTGVRGSLAGDPALVRAVAATGWATVRRGNPGARYDAGTVRVDLVQRVEGQVVGFVTVASADRKQIGQALVEGPDAAGLRGLARGMLAAGKPITTPFPGGSSELGVLSVCGRPYGLVLAPPGTPVRASWLRDISASGQGVVAGVTVPLRTDGSAVFPLSADNVHVRLLGDNSLLSVGGSWTPPADVVARAVAAAPSWGRPDPGIVGAIVSGQFDALPVPQADLRVLWAGRAASGLTVAVAATRLPSGAYYVWAGSATSGLDSDHDDWSGILPAGRLDRALLAWTVIGRAGDPVAVWSARGDRATLTPGGTTVPLTGGGTIVPSATRVTVPGAGSTPVNGGLLPMPRA